MKIEKNSDEHIIQSVLNGDKNSFKLIVDKYQKQIFNIGLRFFKNVEDSYDFTQEVFIKAFQKLGTFRGLSPFRFWLTRIAYNHGINRIKTIREEREVTDNLLSSGEISPENNHFEGEVKQLLAGAIEKLPERYKICLDFYFYMGFNYSQISEITGYPVNTIKSNVFRAKSMLRDGLKGTIAEEYHELR